MYFLHEKEHNTKGQGTALNPNPKVGFQYINNNRNETLHFNNMHAATAAIYIILADQGSTQVIYPWCQYT